MPTSAFIWMSRTYWKILWLQSCALEIRHHRDPPEAKAWPRHGQGMAKAWPGHATIEKDDGLSFQSQKGHFRFSWKVLTSRTHEFDGCFPQYSREDQELASEFLRMVYPYGSIVTFFASVFTGEWRQSEERNPHGDVFFLQLLQVLSLVLVCR